MPAGLQAPSLPAAHLATTADVTCSTHHGPGWVLETPQGEQPGRFTDAIITPLASECDADGHFDSGHTGRNEGDMPSFTAFAEFDSSSLCVPGWVPGAPPKGSSLSTLVLCPPHRQEPCHLTELALSLIRITMPIGP